MIEFAILGVPLVNILVHVAIDLCICIPICLTVCRKACRIDHKKRTKDWVDIKKFPRL